MSALLRTTVCGAAIAAVGIAAALPANAVTATSSRATLDSAPAWTAKAHPAAKASTSQQLRLSVTLKLRDAAGAQALATAVSSPSSSSYRKFVSAAQWRSRFAPTNASLRTVTSWLSANGFTVGAIPANHRTVAFTGTVAQAQKAFGTTLKAFNRHGVTALAPTRSISVPTSLAGVVAGVSGLDTSAQVKPLNVGGATYKPKGSSITAKATPKDQLPPPGEVYLNAGPCSSYYGELPARNVPAVAGLNPLTYVPCGYKPGQLRSAYQTDQNLRAGTDGRGATVAILDAYASPTVFADAQTYAARNDPSHPLRSSQFGQVLPASYTDVESCDAAGWYGEESLDVEAVHAMAPAANIVYVGATSCGDNDLLAALNTVVDNQMAQIVTNSYGDLGELPKADVAGDHQTYLQAAAEGITVMFSSGDNGDEADNLGMRQPDATGNDPWVTAVGGTSLAVAKDGSYEWEQGWGTGNAQLNHKQWDPLPAAWYYGGGGGESNVWAEPAYQKGVVPTAIATQTQSGAAGRTVPDVSMVADGSTGFLIGQTQMFPDGKAKYSEYRIGGTSLSSPLYAGFTALMDQSIGGSLGFLNPLLYGNFYGSDRLTDVNHGRKVTDAVVRVNYNAADDPTSSKTRFLRTINQTESIYTRKGYDDVTGVGSPVGATTLAYLAAHR